MKTLVSIFIFVFSTVYAFAQRLDNATINTLPKPQQLQVTELVKQSRHARTGAVVMLVGGGAMGVGGFVLAVDRALHNNYRNPDNQVYINRGKAGYVLMLAGSASMLGSIPFWFTFRKHRRAARAIIIDYRRSLPAPGVLLPAGGSAAGLGLAIPLGR